MHIEHIAIWTYQLEKLKDFYTTYFNGSAGEKYINEKKLFHSYFISFESGSRLEIMTMPGLEQKKTDPIKQHTGIIHLAFDAGSREGVELLTERLRADGFTIAGELRLTGDGYYESIVLDPDGNMVEIASKA